MCTLSLFYKPGGFRVFMNRDERHDRASELSPRIINPRNGIYGPVDPVSNGTWIAYNENGFWGCLLNGYFEKEDIPSGKNEYQSRGDILPFLLEQDNPLEEISKLDPQRYLSFRLLIGSSEDYVLYEWNGTTYSETNLHASYEDRAFFLSSSSWKQNDVIEIRKILFEQWAKEHRQIPVDIPDFHLSTQPTPESAPLMIRNNSGTKSITALDITSTGITMQYHSVDNQIVFPPLKELEHA